MGNTRIEWTKKTWNPVTGCTKISPGCQNCYAERMSKRLRGRCGYPVEDPFRVTLHPERLEEPLRWRKPSMIFVCSMGDLFHEDVPFDYIDRVFKRINGSPQHDFLILTKRPERMREYFARSMKFPCAACQGTGCSYCLDHGYQNWEMKPYSNVWLGVTAENRPMWDERVNILKQLAAAKRFVSYEPALGSLGEVDLSGLDWVICGGETGPDARPVHPDWVRGLRDQCQSAGVPFFFKSWGEWVCRPWSSDNGRKRELCLGMDGTSVYAQVGHMMGFRKPGEALMVRVGKKAAGRLLDGQEWNEMPEAQS